VLTVAGVQNDSTLKIDFNPSYQTLTLHWVRLWRGTNFLSRLEADKVRVVRREKDLEQQILNGEQTAMLVLDDVRVGDLVDYAYTVEGVNPVFNGRYSAGFRMQFVDPVERLFTRVVWPAQRRFYSLVHGSALQPVLSAKTDPVECVWDVRQVPGLRLEDALPVWCDPEPWVQLTEFKTWAEVNQWALGLFQNNTPLSPELLQKIRDWKQLASPEQQVLAALRFVQDEVRYFGIEIGVSANRPTDPATVAARRFGDCKDKSLLLVTLLRSLGIEAYPVLVNTEARQTIQTWLPAAGSFDHCIAAVGLGGQTWWLDPTASYQRGSLAAHYLPNYGCGLVIAPQTTGLPRIPQTTGLPLTTTTEYFELGRKQGVSDLKVVTVAEGRDAEVLRATLASNKRSDLEKVYTHYYSDTYPGTKLSAPLEVEDDEAQNRVQITERYTIDNVWIKSDKDSKYRCEFYPQPLAFLTRKPVDVQRKLPLAVSFPQHQVLRTLITVPDNWTSWKYDKEDKTVADPAFVFRKKSRRNGSTLTLEYEYQSLADGVPASRVDEYLQNLAKVSKNFGNVFVWK
jgi:transglutaminase-like putative cysteine protease